MRRLFLHIGAHKTGTTALQQNMAQNRVLLGVCGVAYVSSPSAGHLHPYLGPVANGRLLPEGFMVLDPDGLVARLRAAEHDLVVASSENFSFFFHKAQIVALEQVLRPLFDEITIVSYLRRQDRHAVSHHQEGAKPHRQAEGDLWGHAPTALPLPNPAQDLYLDYDRRLGLWAEVFGADRMILRVYDRALLKSGDIFADFLSVIGLNISGLPSVGDRNVSLGAAQTKAGHLMNGAGLRARVAETVLARLPGGGRLLPARAEAMAFLDRYRTSNRRLNDRLRVSDQPDLFNDDFADYPETAQNGWTEDGANATLTALMAELTDTTPALAALTADDLRSAAVALTETSPEIAHRLINAAAALRPNGPVILRIKADLDRRFPG
jgi:hypothetical protein